MVFPALLNKNVCLGIGNGEEQEGQSGLVLLWDSSVSLR